MNLLDRVQADYINEIADSLVKDKDAEKEKDAITKIKGEYLNRKLGFTIGDLVKVHFKL